MGQKQKQHKQTNKHGLRSVSYVECFPVEREDLYVTCKRGVVSVQDIFFLIVNITTTITPTMTTHDNSFLLPDHVDHGLQISVVDLQKILVVLLVGVTHRLEDCQLLSVLALSQWRSRGCWRHHNGGSLHHHEADQTWSELLAGLIHKPKHRAKAARRLGGYEPPPKLPLNSRARAGSRETSSRRGGHRACTAV